MNYGLLDDFGQSADLLRFDSARSESSVSIFIRACAGTTTSCDGYAAARFATGSSQLRFTASDHASPDDKPRSALSSICGWIFYNPLDQALVLCDRRAS